MAADRPEEIVIDIHGLTKRFGAKTVVDDVSLDVRRGEIVGFLGPNGSGKTTTIRMICGLLRPDGGSGTCLGLDILRDADRIKRQVGYMTQRFSYYEDLTIRENLDFVARIYALPDRAAIVKKTLERLGLYERRDQLAGSLSGGWKQRLALAASVMHQPKLLLLDEPTAGVDPQARREFWDEIHALAEDGLTVLVSTHYMDEAERCHRIIYIAYGKIVARGTVAEVIERSGLSTIVVSGSDVGAIARLVREKPGVEQVAPFGNDLHVVGPDAAALKQAVDAALAEAHSDAVAEPGETSLEDVFIRLMQEAQARDRSANGDPSPEAPS
ncbi:ATP-binding cassette domain-containing protein [Kaistia sp. UC242_56]|uniref:ABC transporter ATP-binding protein n=1 Tax=Kaistia sp. UC242_56 TaxID=3374625 RepID=UPI00379CBFD7